MDTDLGLKAKGRPTTRLGQNWNSSVAFEPTDIYIFVASIKAKLKGHGKTRLENQSPSLVTSGSPRAKYFDDFESSPEH